MTALIELALIFGLFILAYFGLRKLLRKTESEDPGDDGSEFEGSSVGASLPPRSPLGHDSIKLQEPDTDD